MISDNSEMEVTEYQNESDQISRCIPHCGDVSSVWGENQVIQLKMHQTH